MTEQNPDSNLKEYEKLVNGQRPEWLEKELHLRKTQLTAIENLGPEEEQEMYLRKEFARSQAEMAAEADLDPDASDDDLVFRVYLKMLEKDAEKEVELAAMDPLDRKLMQAKGRADLAPPSLLTMRAELKRRIRILERAINARLDQEFSKGEAPSASAGTPTLHEPPVPDVATRKASNLEYGKRKRTGKHRKPDKNVGNRRKIVRGHPKESPKALCILFDDAGILLPRGPDWETHRKDKGHAWVSSFEDPWRDYNLRQRIYEIINHDRLRA